MADNDTRIGETEPAPEVENVAEPEFDRLVGVVTDGFIGAVGGFVGTSVMTVWLLIGSSIGAFDFTSFAILTQLSGLVVLTELTAVDAQTVGYAIFLFGGMVTWPLLLASLGRYLPGRHFARKGLPFGFVLWTGFAPAFYQGYTGMALALYLVLTLVGHLSYGFTLGAVFDYLSTRPETLV